MEKKKLKSQTVYLGHSSTQLQRMKVYLKPVVQFFDIRNNILQQIESHLECNCQNIVKLISMKFWMSYFNRKVFWGTDRDLKHLTGLLSYVHNVPCHWWDSGGLVETAGPGGWPACGAFPQWCHPCPAAERCQCARGWWEWTVLPGGLWWTSWRQKASYINSLLLNQSKACAFINK